MFSEYCIIFDMDGVLADTGPIHFESWVKMAREIGVEFTKDFFERTFGKQSIPITRELVGSNTDQQHVKKWANLKEEYYREMVKGKLEPLPGVINLIKNLKAKELKIAVGSSGPSANVELLLRSLKIKHFFDIIVTAEDIEQSKPAPDVFLYAAKKLNIKPEQCLVIEDAPVGIIAAKRAGMKVIALTTTHHKDDLPEADLIIKDLSYIDVSDILKLLS
jgi:beta-phosphoglucomutase family hydrolase